MAGFVDNHLRSVDEKGRVIIPSEYRSKLGSEFIAARGWDEQITLFTEQQWEVHFNKYADGDERDPEVRRQQRIMSATASRVRQDSQGRTVIPQKLRDFAGITDNVYFAGITKKVELWNADKYREYMGDDI